MKNYLLTIIGGVESEKMCGELAISISPIVNSSNLKFQHSKGIMLFYFASQEEKSEIYNYVKDILYGLTDNFILTEITDNVSVSLEEETMKHLFDLENVNENVTMRIDMERILKNMDFVEEEDIEDDFMALLLGQKEKVIKEPSLDCILDKINSSGYDSLNSYEKDTLKKYSKS